jgi:hypothetical protein
MKTATLAALALLGGTAEASYFTCASAWLSTGGGNCATAVAVCMAESGGNPSARNVNSDSHHSVDRGLWQVNNYWHPEVSDSCAFSSGCNAKAALKISSGGSNWSPWATYNGGAYKSHLSRARSACHIINEAQEKEVANEARRASCTHKFKQLCGHCGGDKGCWLSCAKSHKGQLLAAGCHPSQWNWGGLAEEKEVATEAQVGGEPASCTQKLTQLCGHGGSDKSCWISCAKQNEGALIAAGCKPPQVSDSCSRCKANWATGVLKGEIEALGMDSDYFDCDSSPACQKEVRDEITKKLRGPEAKCSGNNCVDCGVAIAGCSLACAVAFPEGCISCITGYGGCCRCGSEHFGYDCKYC